MSSEYYTKIMIELYTFELYVQDLDKSRGSYSIRGPFW
jgi:hypothetical protein